MKTLKYAAFGAGILMASTAYAAPPVNLTSTCKNTNGSPKTACVYNNQGVPLGISESFNTMLRPIGSTWYTVNLADQRSAADLTAGNPKTVGLSFNALFFYATPNCTGQPYTVDYEIPQTAAFDGVDGIWAPGTAIPATQMGSYSYWGPPSQGYCYPWPYKLSYGAVAVKVETIHDADDFSVK